jgi:hypothetical protein
VPNAFRMYHFGSDWVVPLVILLVCAAVGTFAILAAWLIERIAVPKGIETPTDVGRASRIQVTVVDRGLRMPKTATHRIQDLQSRKGRYRRLRVSKQGPLTGCKEQLGLDGTFLGGTVGRIVEKEQ